MQQAAVGEEFTIDLFNLGDQSWTITDDVMPLDIHYQLDPDDTPDGVTIDPATGVVSWTPDASQTGMFDILVIAIDGGTPALPDVEILQIAVGVRPEMDLNGAADGTDVDAGTFTEGDPALLLAPDLTLTDDGTIASATITLGGLQDGAAEQLTVNTGVVAATINDTYDPLTGILTLTGSASPSDYATVLRTVRYENTSTSPTPGLRNITFSVQDDTGLDSTVRTATVNVVAVNDPPALDLNGADGGVDAAVVDFVEDGGPVNLLSPDVTITDSDDTMLESAQIALDAIFDSEMEILAVDTSVVAAAINDSYDPLTGVLTLTGTASLADYEAVIETLTYDNTSDTPDTTQRTVRLTVNDGENDSNEAVVPVNVAATNDPAFADLNGTDESGNDFETTFAESASATGVAIVDTDAAIVDPDGPQIDSITITLTNRPNDTTDGVGTEQLTMNGSVTDIDFNYDSTTGIATLTNVGSADRTAFETALRQIFYTNSSLNPDTTDRTINVVVNDGVADGPPSTTIVHVLADVNDPPDLAEPASPLVIAVDETGMLTLTATDPENGTLTFTLDENSVLPGMALDAATGEFTWTPTIDQVGQHMVTVLVTDAGTPTQADTETFTVIVTDRPKVDLNGDDGEGIDLAAPVPFKQGDPPVAVVESDLTVMDMDDANLASATIVLDGVQDGSDETVSVDDTEATTRGLMVATDTSVPGRVTLLITPVDPVGAPVAQSDWQAVLRTLQYENNAATPTSGTRTVIVTVSDGKLDSQPATATVEVNVPPMTLLSGEGGGSSDFDATLDLTAAMTEVLIVDVDATIVDPDDTTLQSLTITLTNRLNGTDEELLVDTTGTSVNVTTDSQADTLTLTLTGGASLTEYVTVLRTLTYRNVAASVVETLRSITVVANDGTHEGNVAEARVTIVSGT